jgi:hypothetical protein
MTDKLIPEGATQAPYYDDYDEDKLFHRIMFRPGYAVQGRELTQLQTIMQKQVARFGEHIFQNGSIVSGGQIIYQGETEGLRYINLQSSYANTAVVANSFVGKTITTLTAAAANATTRQLEIAPSAYVLAATEQTSTEPPVLIVKPTSGYAWPANTAISTDDGTGIVAATATSAVTGNSSVVSIETGVYFFNGYFAKVLQQTLILDKFGNEPTYRVGLEYEESIVDENSDTSLLDPAQEASNYQAPGATRLKLTLTLAKRDFASTDDSSFIELLRVKNGSIRKKVVYPTYGELERTLARRTFDESGNYTVAPFTIELLTHQPESIDGRINIAANTATVTGSNTYFLVDTPVNTVFYVNGASALVSTVSSNVSMTLANNIVYPVTNFTRALAVNPNRMTIKLSPGKAYVKGFEFETISPTLLNLDRGRDFANVTTYGLSSTIGNSLTVTNMRGVPDVSTMELFDIHRVNTAQLDFTTSNTYSNTIIGTARIRGIEYVSASNTSNGFLHTYTIYLQDNSVANANFTMNAAQSLATFSGAGNTAFNKRMDIDVSSKSNGLANGNTFITDSNFNILVFKYPQSTIKAASISGANYQYRKFVSNVNFTAGSATITVVAPEAFKGSGALSDSGKLSDFTIILRDKGTLPAGYANGDILPMSTSLGRSVTVSPITTATLATGLANNFVADIIHTTTLSGTAPVARVKTRVNANTANIAPVATATIANTGTGVFVTAGQIQIANAANVSRSTDNPQRLYVADVIRLAKVVDFGSLAISQANLASATDITGNYILDTGQRDNSYDHATITLKSGAVPCRGPLVAWFDFYTHSGSSGFLTVDSYPSATTNDGYTNVSTYTSATSGTVYSLRDCVDWRPIRSNATEANTLLNVRILQPRTSFTSSFSYYLARIDKIVLTADRNFKVIQGIPSLYPETPTEGQNDMLLYTLVIPPFTFNASDVDVRFNENKRYTMRDIGKLEKRITNLEYYTALSMLEKDADSMQIVDGNGLNRFKNGIVVDSFNGHKVGDVASYDYLCAMDFEKGELYPTFSSNTASFVHDAAGSTAGSYSRAYINGQRLFMLPFTQESYLQQGQATDAVNVNPFNATSWIGTLVLNPDNDTWYDQQRKPQVLVNIEGENDAWEQIGAALTTLDARPNGFGTRYGDWNSTWSGVTDSYVENSSSQYQQGYQLIQQNVQRTIQTVTTKQARTITTKTVSPQTITKTIGDNVVDVSVIPYIRSRDVYWRASGLKPGSIMYPFFDNVNVLGYYISPSVIAIGPSSVNYWRARMEPVTFTSGGSGIIMIGPRDETSNGRLYIVGLSGNVNVGDVATGSLSNATATVIAVASRPSDNVASANANNYIVKLSNTFSNLSSTWCVGALINIPKGTGAGQTRIISSYDNVTRTIVVTQPFETALDNTSVYSVGHPRTLPSGDVTGTFAIPAGMFFTGQKKFRVTTSPRNAIDMVGTWAEANYFAQGLLQTKQEQTVSVRVPTVIQTTAGEERTITTGVVASSEVSQYVIRDDTPPPYYGGGGGSGDGSGGGGDYNNGDWSGGSGYDGNGIDSSGGFDGPSDGPSDGGSGPGDGGGGPGDSGGGSDGGGGGSDGGGGGSDSG